MSTIQTDAPITEQTVKHEPWCTSHLWPIEVDFVDASWPGWCRHVVSLHDVQLVMVPDDACTELRCELSVEDAVLTAQQMREVAAVLIEKADVLEDALAAGGAA